MATPPARPSAAWHVDVRVNPADIAVIRRVDHPDVKFISIEYNPPRAPTSDEAEVTLRVSAKSGPDAEQKARACLHAHRITVYAARGRRLSGALRRVRGRAATRARVRAFTEISPTGLRPNPARAYAAAAGKGGQPR